MDAERTILVVDDTPMLRDLGALFLARTARVLTASDGVEALELARREHPDVVVSDLWMPRMGGDDLCRAIRADEVLRHTPVILLTTGECADEHARAVRSGASDVLCKPLERVLLIQAVNRFLRSSELRGLARVPLETPVQIRCQGRRALGRVRNLSRGGLFVEAEAPPPIDCEVELAFQLPDTRRPISPTAKVIWTRKSDELPAGVGLQFLALDRTSARFIEEFVHERMFHALEDPATAAVA